MATTSPRVPTRCPACGRGFNLSAANPRPPSLCPECGSPTDAPPERRRDDPTRNEHLLVAGSDEDDGKAYGFFGEKPEPPCPGCGKSLPEDAPVCERCNWNRDAGRVLPRTYTPVDVTWESGWSLRLRLGVFLACQVLNVATVAMAVSDGAPAPVGAVGYLVAVAIQAFVLGTYDRLRLVRTSKGKVTITKTWRACFIPLPTNVLRWRNHEGLVVRRTDADTLDWIILLAMAPSVLPAILWWWSVIRTGRITVAFSQNLGDPVTVLYAGGDLDRAEEIAQTVRETTGMTYDPLA